MEVPRINLSSVFENKRVFLTGHTGFKGSWLALWLHSLGAKVHGYSLPPPTDPSNYALSNVHGVLCDETIGDILDRKRMSETLSAFKPDVVFHLAAQSLVRDSYVAPFETYEVNVMGTASLLDGVREMRRPCAVVCVTTDKCYENREQVWGYRECDPMGGFDPYSASKGAAEILIASYRRSFFHPNRITEHGVLLASARAGNVIGGGDWARDRIVTDMVAALRKGCPMQVRNPHAIRPWQHVLEPLSGYLTLAAAMLNRPEPVWCDGWNFGPATGTETTVSELAENFIRGWGAGSWTDVSDPSQPHEAATLRLCIDKSLSVLGWAPCWSLKEAVCRTALWYKSALCEGASPQALCLEDIEAYCRSGSGYI